MNLEKRERVSDLARPGWCMCGGVLKHLPRLPQGRRGRGSNEEVWLLPMNGGWRVGGGRQQ